MINVKDQVGNALERACGNVTDTYPKSWAELPAVQFVEEDNSVVEWTGGQEQKAYLRYRVDIWDNKSTSETALWVDREVSNLGLRRIACQDVDDPSGLKHKLMRYEGIIDVHTEMVYQNN